MRYRLFYRRGQKNAKRGVALILTFMIMVTVMTVAMAFLFMLNTRSRGTASDVASHKALWVAEAGLQSVIYRLKTDIAYRNDPTQVMGSVGDGSYLVSVSKDVDTYTLNSAGTVDVIEREITQSVIVAGSDAFDYAVVAGSNIQTNNATNLTITGDQQGGATSFPAVDLAYYQGIAPPGQDISGDYTFTPGTYSGIWYIGGNVTIESNVTINGSIITEGKISASRESTIEIDPDSHYPAMVANDNIDFNRSSDLVSSGLIYAGVDGSGVLNFSRADTVDISGTVIAADNVNLSRSNNLTITYDSSITTDPPPGITVLTVELQRDWNEN